MMPVQGCVRDTVAAVDASRRTRRIRFRSTGRAVRCHGIGRLPPVPVTAGVVAQGCLTRQPASAQRQSCGPADHAAIEPAHLEIASHVERPVADRRERCRYVRCLLRAIIVTHVPERATGTAQHGLRNVVSLGCPGVYPGATARIEDLRKRTHAIRAVNAQVSAPLHGYPIRGVLAHHRGCPVRFIGSGWSASSTRSSVRLVRAVVPGHLALRLLSPPA
jgi:hypothetical protein